ncbi:hypothetical protein [Burkholderia sp. Ax-1719]|uniref:hypothetical protein n=1 Tax=Burkholderia sp. Ax-1719 TaxID=2608334 RepID=UPI001420D0A4|nr:hypothetical protein [Burkholderia sp. Ax-1719]NIE63228.1 hypothetical protein [Burkholderia sp. Ax-1719]
MHASLYPTFEYCVRALRLRHQGLSAIAIEQCTGVPHNLQDELIPLTAIASSATRAEVEALAREAASSISLEKLALVRAASELWTGNRLRLPVAQRGMPISVSLDELTRRVSAQPTLVTASRTDILGARDRPLTSESSISLAFRLMERNALRWNAARNPLKVALPQTPGQFGAKISVAFDASFEPFEWAETLDQQLVAALPHTAGVLLRHNFTFCPECLAGGFHSVAHQMAFTHECAIHGLPLRQACVHCDAATGTVETILKRGWEASKCKGCDKPLCGSALDASSRRRFRETLADAQSKLHPFIRWLEQAQQRLWPLEQLLVQNASAVGNWTEWGCSATSLLKLAGRLHPFPADSTIENVPDVELLRWSNRLRAAPKREGIGQAQNFDVTSVYALTLRAIEAWRRSRTSAPFNTRTFADLAANSVVSPDEVAARDLAIAYFRNCFEDGPGNLADWTLSRPSTAKCQATLTAQPTTLKHRLPAKALMMGTFAVALSAIETRRGGGVQRSRLEWLRAGRGVPLALLPEIGGPAKHLAFSEGAVATPLTHGFPAYEIYLNH